MNKIILFLKKQLFIFKLNKMTKNKVLFEFLENNGYYFINENGDKQYKMPY